MQGVRIPLKANADSEGNANSIPGRRRNVLGERSDTGSSIVQELFVSVKKNLSGAKRRLAGDGQDRGADSLPFSQVFFEASVRFRVASKRGKLRLSWPSWLRVDERRGHRLCEI